MNFLGGLSRLLNRGNTSTPTPGKTQQDRAAYFTQTNPVYNKLVPGSFITTPQLQQSALKPKLAIDPNSTPKAQAVFSPMDGATKDVINRAAPIFSFTPKFKSILDAAQPQAVTDKSLSGGSSLKSLAAGVYWNGQAGPYANSQKLELAKGYGSSPGVVAHEGLHAVFNTVPGAPQAFGKVYQADKTPDLEAYLNGRLKNYTAYGGRPALDNFNKLPKSVQSEVHSYLSEYPLVTGKVLPPGFENYYKTYVDPNNTSNQYRQRGRALRGIQQSLSKTNPYRVTPGPDLGIED